nr:hypothetical protein BaRGS_018535 [Batillaria attramentaria]
MSTESPHEETACMPDTEQTESMPDLSESRSKQFLSFLSAGVPATSSKSLKSILRSNRAEPTSSSSTSLKSILRSARGEFRPGSPYNPRHLAHKIKRKRVQFLLQNTEEKLEKWNGKKLRALALDLDRREAYPGLSLRFLNRQKIRRIRRFDQYNRLDRASTEASVLDMDLETIGSKCHIDGNKENENEDGSATKTDDAEILDQSSFVNRHIPKSTQGRLSKR